MQIPDAIQIGARTYRVYIIDPDPDTVFDHSSDGDMLGRPKGRLGIPFGDSNLHRLIRDNPLLFTNSSHRK